jgi:putative spermidine/putrescine transport system ATP-binding protein
MNHGLIEQVGSPHEIYNAPATEFVARFMGGHNVIATPAGKVAVRNDHMQVAPAGEAELEGLPAVVTDVEYQGTYVLLGLTAQTLAGESGVSVMLPEATFAHRPYATGESVHLSWHAAHALRA